MERLSVRLTDRMLDQLDALASERGVTRTRAVRQLLAAGLRDAAVPVSEPPCEEELVAILAERARAGNVAAIRTLLAREERPGSAGAGDRPVSGDGRGASVTALATGAFRALGMGATVWEIVAVARALRASGDAETLALFERAADLEVCWDRLVALADRAGAGGLVALDLLTEVVNPGALTERREWRR